MGIFKDSVIQSLDHGRVARCAKCGLYQRCNSPKMAVTGKGKRKVLVVAEAPGAEEDKQGVQLIGKAGQKLRSIMERLDWDLDRDCWKTNACICRPENNRMTDAYIEFCRPMLFSTIDKLHPDVIILLGTSAVKSLIGRYWKSIASLEPWVGWRIPFQPLNAWVCPTYHPSYLERMQSPLLDLWFTRHLEKAFELEGKPWENTPDWKSKIKLIWSSDEAAEILCESEYHKAPAISFDFETDRLKPDAKDSRIVCCSVCWGGKKTIAFPWEGEAIKEMGRLLRSSIPKYGANIRFEQRWSKVKLGHGVKAWEWDCVQAAHVLDNRKGITSVKFQGLVRLGLPPWNEEIVKYLEASGGGNAPNEISKCDLGDLLLYCGIDSLVEYKLAEIQRMEISRL